LIKVRILPDDKITDDDMDIHMGEKTSAYRDLVKKPQRKEITPKTCA